VIAAAVPGAPVPLEGVVKLKSVLKVDQVPALLLKVPAPVEAEVTTSVVEIRYLTVQGLAVVDGLRFITASKEMFTLVIVEPDVFLRTTPIKPEALPEA
jgi:hypothetical protein